MNAEDDVTATNADDDATATNAADDETYPEQAYHYTREYFNPVKGLRAPPREQALIGGDRPEKSPYLYDEEIILAVNTAMAANRPLLLAGPAGTGKSALAAGIAADKEGWKFVSMVVTARTEGKDLQWRFDTVRRLRDAHVIAAVTKPGAPTKELGKDVLTLSAPDAPAKQLADDVLKDKRRYIQRGVLWEAFDYSHKGIHAVVLIDEIDKADSDVPNSLLEVIGNGRFTVDETGETITVETRTPPLIVITTNDERELSRPFRRRCVTLTLKPPDAARLVEVARSWNLASGADAELAEALAVEVEQLGRTSNANGFTANVAEYLDALRACVNLEIKLGGPEWEAVKRATLLKVLDPAVPAR